MSYNIGQFRKDMLSSNSYISQINKSDITITTISVEQNTALDIDVRDTVLQLANNLEYNHNYFLRVGIQRTDLKQQVSIILKKSDSNDFSQIITTVTIPALDTTANTIAIVEAVLAPNSNYDQIVLQLGRSLTDITTTEDFIKLMQRTVTIYEPKLVLGEFINVLSRMTPSPSFLIKMGIQGPAGLLMCINGEEIRIGPNGTYEIKNEYKINFIGFGILPSDADNNYFILDYQY